MDQPKLIESLQREINANQQTIEAVRSERDTLFQSLGQQRTGKAKMRWSSEKMQETVMQLDWMTQLLETLQVEQKRAEAILHLRQREWLNRLHPASPSPKSPHLRRHEATVRRLAAPVQVLASFGKRFVRLGARGLHVLKTEGHATFLLRATQRIYRKLVSRLPRRTRHVRATNVLLPYIFRPIEGGLEANYTQWIRRSEPSEADLMEQRRRIFSYQPRISVVVPTYNTPLCFLLAMMESVRVQTYPHWELCIADGGSHHECLRPILEYYARNDPRIKVKLLPTNEGIAANSNQALALATGDYIVLLDHDDTLSPFALFEIAAAVNQYPDADFLYSDEDKITEEGRLRFSPHFKPAFAPDSLRGINYICHLSVFARALLEKVGGFRSGFEGSQDYDLVLRATEQAQRIVHIPKVLYHWRSHSQSVAQVIESKPYAIAAGEKALREHLKRCRLDAFVQSFPHLGVYRVQHRLPRQPLVSIIIPNKDQAEVLQRCLDSIANSTYHNYEIIIVENNSVEVSTFAYYAELKKRPEVHIVPWNHPFNYAAAINFGVRQSHGEVLLLLNNDVEVINRDWLESLLEHALREEIGAVGAKLYYPNGKIQHAGVTVGMGGIAGHCGLFSEGHSLGPFGLLQRTQNLSAVTGACLMTRRSVYKEAAGLDERFVLSFNDIDFCLKIRQCGYLVIWTPHAELYHYESLTRGPESSPEKQARFQSEIRLFVQKWRAVLDAGDPYYNPNLTLVDHDWSVRANGAGPLHPRAVANRSACRIAA